MSEQHETVSAYFHFIHAAQDTCPALVYTGAGGALLPMLLQLSAHAVALPERAAVKAASVFLVKLMTNNDASYHASIGAALTPQLELLIGQLVRAVVLPRQKQAGVLHALSETLFNMRKWPLFVSLLFSCFIVILIFRQRFLRLFSLFYFFSHVNICLSLVSRLPQAQALQFLTNALGPLELQGIIQT